MNNRAITNLTQQLQKSLDNNYDVVDMETVLYVIQTLETTTITKEQLETTRLARYINELRRRTTSETLARRAKSLLKKWRDIFIQPPPTGTAGSAPGPTSASAVAAAAGTGFLSAPTTPNATNVTTVAAAANASRPSPRNSIVTPKQALFAVVVEASSVPSGGKNISTGSANNNSCSNSNSKMTNSLLSNGGGPIGPASIGPVKKPITPNATPAPALYQNQPTSFANVLSGGGGVGAGAVLVAAAAAAVSKKSPPAYDHRRQSPIDASVLDLDSNHSRSHQMSKMQSTGSLPHVPPAPLHNGDMMLLHDSNSMSLDLPDSGVAAGEHQSTRYGSVSVGGTPAIAAGAPSIDAMCSSSSNHRKSKKHKKDKKKKSPDKPPPTSEITYPTSNNKSKSGLSMPAKYLSMYASAEEAAAASNVFPPHDSLSSSSMSRFPSNISHTNTMTMPNSSRLIANNNENEALGGGSGGGDSAGAAVPSESDLTFAGKFKSSTKNTNTSLSDSGGGEHSLVVPLKKSCSDSKDSSDVVVVESRSSSPAFMTAPRDVMADDSCSIDLTRYSGTTPAAKGKTDSAVADHLLVQCDQNSNGPTASSAVMPIDQTSQHQMLDSLKQPEQKLDAANSATNATAATGTATTAGPKKRGRKKGSRGFDSVIAQNHSLLTMFERPRLLPGGKKVKTTKELLADIQSRKLGSSATSSPTLIASATSRQSVSPSTCSEASFQSDVTNTRASSSLLNTRSSPDLASTLTNCRQSDIEDGNSATDSNEAFSSRLATGSKIGRGFGAATTGSLQSSIDEYLSALIKQLPPIDFAPLREQMENASADGSIVCTCTVREVEQVATTTKEEVEVIVNLEEDNGNDAIDSDVLADEHKMTITVPSLPPAPAPTPAVVPPALAPAPLAAATKKPVKSIFDLDYDDDNDPLHSFVEAAKLGEDEQQPPAQDITTAPSHVLQPAHSHSNSNSRDSMSLPNGSVSVPPIAQQQPAAQLLLQQPPPPPQMPMFPIYEVVEDPDCPARHRYEIQTNRITEHHLRLLHNCYVESVNGNWSADVPMMAEHRKRLRRYYNGYDKSRASRRVSTKKRHTTAEDSSDDPLLTATKIDNWWTADEKFRQLIDSRGEDEADAIGSSDDEALYERVVPRYDFLVMDRIPKNLSHVKFTRNYMNRKLRRLKKKLKCETDDDGTTTTTREPLLLTFKGVENGDGDEIAEQPMVEAATTTSLPSDALRDSDAEERHVKVEDNNRIGVDEPDERTTAKRKRRGSHASNSSLSSNCEEDDNDNDDVNNKHKHRQRKKHRKDDDSTNVDISISSNQLREQSAVEGTSPGPPNSLDIDNEAFQLMSKPNRLSDTTDNACDVDLASGARIGLDATNNLHEEHCSSASLPIVHHQDDDDMDDDVALIESSSNSSMNCTSPTNNNLNDKTSDSSNRMESTNEATDVVVEADVIAPAIITNSVDEDDEYPVDDTNSHDESYYSEDDDEDDYDDDEEEDEDYDEDNNEEHEVVTHDMTSSTSTTSQQHIVLTIKKKIQPKSSSSHHHHHRRLSSSGGGGGGGNGLSTSRNNEQQQLSIITSLTKPTTIKIRRKNNNQTLHDHEPPSLTTEQQHQEQAINSLDERQTTETESFPVASSPKDRLYADDDDDHNNFHDNNNVKVNLGNDLATTDANNAKVSILHVSSVPSRNEDEEKISSIELNDLVDETARVHAPAESMQENASNEVSQQVGTTVTTIVKMEVDEEEDGVATMQNKSCDMNIIKEPAPAPTAIVDKDEDDESSFSTSTSSSSSSDDDDDEDPEQNPLPKQNNGLLMSFNRLGDDSLTGVRVVKEPTITTTTTTSTTITSSSIPGQADEETSAIAAPNVADAAGSNKRDTDGYKVEEFKEWHELLQVPSYNNELLTILPYVVID